MEKKFKLGIIGAGFMASAIVKGIIDSKYLSCNQIIVTDISDIALEKISLLGVTITKDCKYLSENCEYILFAVKPQNSVEVLNTISSNERIKVITIMAGVKKDKIKKFLPNSLVARCMPNTPCSIGKGVIGADLLDFSEDDSVFINGLLNSISKTVLISEDKMNTVTGVSGSSPAYFYYFIKSIIECGVKNGLSYEQAKTLSVETMIGSAEMIKNNPDKKLDELINAVCSKGGTTIEAIKTFDQNNLDKIIEQAVQNCINRSKELENL